jgi:hypothetical protein
MGHCSGCSNDADDLTLCVDCLYELKELRERSRKRTATSLKSKEEFEQTLKQINSEVYHHANELLWNCHVKHIDELKRIFGVLMTMLKDSA